MKKCFVCLLALCLLVGITLLTAPEARAATHTDHCVCGGYAHGIGDHVCQTVQWQPLSSVENINLKKMDWSLVPSGYYYLDADVVVTIATDSHCIGSAVKNSDGTYEVKSRQISLCLNGHNITTTMDRVFKGIYTDSALTICDCAQKENWGTIKGGTSATGGIFYSYAQSKIDLYGGNYTVKTPGQTAKTGGGLFYIAQDRAPVGSTDASKKDPQYASIVNIYEGNYFGGTSEKAGGNMVVAHCCVLNVYGGAIYNGTAHDTEKGGGNIYATGQAKANLYGGDIYGGYPEVAKVITNGEASQEYTLKNAVENCKEGSIICLYRDLETDLTLSKEIVLDLNGHHLSGITGNVTCFDSGAGQGSLNCNGTVTAAEGYVKYPTENGVKFYQADMAITHMSINPSKTAIGYKAKLTGNLPAEEVQEMGLEMWLEGYNHCRFGKTGANTEISLRLKNILGDAYTEAENAANAETPVYAFAYVVLTDGTRITGETVAYSFKDMLHAADDNYDSFTPSQQYTLQSLASKYSKMMMTWDVENFHHATGGMWTKVNASEFNAKLTKNGSYYDIKPGSYVLTEDVDLDSKTLRVVSDTTVTICLNGHTIKSSERLVRICGTFNLCDCHEHGDAEGNLISSLATIKDADGNVVKKNHGAVFYTYYNSTFNLYGGNLKATGQVTNAGIGAISHEKLNDATLGTQPAGIMNMYGGTLSGGNATARGGLLWVLHGASFNMYGGELRDGKASDGGAICINEGSYANLYGGNIHDCNNAIDLTHENLTLAGDVQIDRINVAQGVKINMENLSPKAKVGLYTQYYGYLTDNTAVKNVFTLNEGQQVVEYNGKLYILEADVEEHALQNKFSVGHSQICINPETAEGIPLSGYGNSANRLSTGFESEMYYLYANATAITDAEGNTILLITHDLQRPQEEVTDAIRQAISEAVGLPVENILLSASHSHSTPDLRSSNAKIKAYKILLQNKFVQAAVEAMASRVPASMQAGIIDEVKNDKGKLMNHSRHYTYVDENGVRQYYGDNFGKAPSTDDAKATLAHVTEGDHSMLLVRFIREGEKEVILCNWAAHPNMTGGSNKTQISSDYVGALRYRVQQRTDCYFSFIQGAAGNMNTTSRISGESTYGKAEYLKYGNALADIVVNYRFRLNDIPTGKLQLLQTGFEANVMKYDDDVVANAEKINALPTDQREGKLAEYGFSSIYHVSSVLEKMKLGDTVILELNAFSIGDQIAFYTLPGELWSTAADVVKEQSSFPYTITTGYTNGDWKYFPYGEAADGTYDNYEYHYCRFVLPTTTEGMISWWNQALDTLYKNANK